MVWYGKGHQLKPQNRWTIFWAPSGNLFLTFDLVGFPWMHSCLGRAKLPCGEATRTLLVGKATGYWHNSWLVVLLSKKLGTDRQDTLFTIEGGGLQCGKCMGLYLRCGNELHFGVHPVLWMSRIRSCGFIYPDIFIFVCNLVEISGAGEMAVLLKHLLQQLEDLSSDLLR